MDKFIATLVEGRVYSVIPSQDAQKFIDMGWEVVYRTYDEKLVIVSKKDCP